MGLRTNVVHKFYPILLNVWWWCLRDRLYQRPWRCDHAGNTMRRFLHYSVVGGIEVHRPAYLVVPGLLRAVWSNEVAYYMLRTRVAKLHWKHRFDAILSFDLFNAGGLAWRISRELGIPAAGWATGGDMRKERDSRPGRKLVETIRNLDLVFYQSQELLELAAELLESNVEHLERSGRHQDSFARNKRASSSHCRKQARAAPIAITGVSERSNDPVRG